MPRLVMIISSLEWYSNADTRNLLHRVRRDCNNNKLMEDKALCIANPGLHDDEATRGGFILHRRRFLPGVLGIKYGVGYQSLGALPCRALIFTIEATQSEIECIMPLLLYIYYVDRNRKRADRDSYRLIAVVDEEARLVTQGMIGRRHARLGLWLAEKWKGPPVSGTVV